MPEITLGWGQKCLMTCTEENLHSNCLINMTYLKIGDSIHTFFAGYIMKMDTYRIFIKPIGWRWRDSWGRFSEKM